LIAYGNRYQRERAVNFTCDWLIVNHAMFRTYELPPVRTLIIDESHHFRGRKAKQSTNLRKYAADVPYIFMLTATPIVRESDDLFMQLSILYPKVFTSYWSFVDRYCKTQQTPWILRVIGIKQPAVFRIMLSKYALGRSYEDVALELPELITNYIPIEFTPEQLSNYRATKMFHVSNGVPLQHAVQVLLELRRMCVCPQKIEAARSLLEDIAGPVVVFTYFRESAHKVAEALRCACVTGELTPAQRMEIVDRKQTLVATIDSISEGVSLAHMSAVVMFEETYIPGQMFQAISRVRRHGAAGNILLYYIHMVHSIDETIHRCLERRITDIKQILDLELST